MNWRATIAAGLIFIALLAFVWVESGHRVAEEGEVFRHSFMGLDLYGIDAEKVTSLRIQRADEEDIVVEKRDDDWFLVEPFAGLADGEEVTRMVREIAELTPRTARENVDLAQEQFGLAGADLVATISYNGEKTATLKIGAETPSGTDRYAQASTSDKLYVVGASTRTTLWKDPQKLREKSVASVEPEQVQTMTLDHGEEHIVVAQSEGDEEPRWRLTAPLDTAADEWNVKQAINKIGDMRAEAFLTAEEAEEADLGFKEPQAAVRFELDEGDPLTVTFGNSVTREVGEPAEEQDLVYVRTSRRSDVMLVKATRLDEVQKTAFDLRDKSVVSFKRDRVVRVKVERPEGFGFAIARRPDGWFVEKPEKVEARQGAVDDILWNLEDLSATEFVVDEAGPKQLREYGLGVPQATIAIELTGRDEPITILVGDETEDGDFYATTGDEGQVVTISDFLMRDLPEDLSELKQLPADAPSPDMEGPETGAVPELPAVPGSPEAPDAPEAEESGE
jgi:hypothetical protein